MKRFQLYKVVRNGRLIHCTSVEAENRIEAIKKSEELRNKGYIVDLLPKGDIAEIKIVKGGEL